jgi:formylmethanofuran dehydrogenase subunit E
VYPDHSIDYLSSGITHGGLDDTENTLDTDFLYFDSERDAELPKVLHRMAKQDETRKRSSTEIINQWTSTPSRC